MVTWQLDRLLRSGPLCALATFLIPAAMAVAVAAASDVENVLGVMLVSSGLMLIGSVAGSAVTTGAGAVIFALGALVAETPPVGLVLVGAGLFATMVVHDLAGSFRRAPSIDPALWRMAASTVVAVAAAAAVSFGAAYALATLTLWQAAAFPVGLIAIGLAAKLASDGHRARMRRTSGDAAQRSSA